MSDTRQEFADELMKQRQLTPSTCKTYVSCINTLYTKMDGKDGVKFFHEKAGDVCEQIAKTPKIQTQKTQLCALFVMTGLQIYRDHMQNAASETAKQYAEHKRSDKREDRKKSFDEIKAIHAALFEAHRKDPTALNRNNLLISGLCSGVYNPPRRLLDWTECLLSGGKKGEDNYIEKKQFILNKYKTAAKDRANGQGPTVIPVPQAIQLLITRTKKLCPEQQYLIVNSSGEKFTSSSLNKRLLSLFGMGIDELRSVYLNDVTYADSQINKLQNTADLMGNSVDAQIGFYLKK